MQWLPFHKFLQWFFYPFLIYACSKLDCQGVCSYLIHQKISSVHLLCSSNLKSFLKAKDEIQHNRIKDLRRKFFKNERKNGNVGGNSKGPSAIKML